MMRTLVVVTSHDSFEFVDLAGHDDSQNGQENELENESSLEGAEPHWVLGDVGLDGPETLLSDVKYNHTHDERDKTHGFQNVINSELSFRHGLISIDRRG